MAIPKSKYKYVAFSSNFAYLHAVVRGTANAYAYSDPYGTYYAIDQSIAIPATVTIRPPIVRFFLEQQGKIQDLNLDIGIYAGVDNNIIRIYKPNTSYYPFNFKVHYVIYDRKAN